MFELKENSNIRNIKITEIDDGAVVEVFLADALEVGDSVESLDLVVHVYYDKEQYVDLDWIKKEALLRARTVITNEIKRIQSAEAISH
jgi:hypothetical protein